MKSLLIRWAIIAVAVWLTSLIMPGMTIVGGVTGILLVSLVFGLINAIIKPIVKLLTCPLVLLTLGLFVLVINTLMLMLTAVFLPQYLQIEGAFGGFFTAFFASIIISIITVAIDFIVPDGD
jgi:putative membrane protein